MTVAMPENNEKSLFQISLTPAAGKRLIARALAEHDAIQRALKKHTLAIIAGTTNGYIAQEILRHIDPESNVNPHRFFRGLSTPPHIKKTSTGRLPDESAFPGDVIISQGRWVKGKTIYDVADMLDCGDIILKGANCIDCAQQRAGVLVGHHTGGTITTALSACIGKRVRLIHPAGLEKRITGSIDQAALLINAEHAHGPRLLPSPGEIFTELDAIPLLYGCTAHLVAAGGVCGAEGSIWLAVEGEKENCAHAHKELLHIAGEKNFHL